MIGDNIANGKAAYRVAAEDALVIFTFTFISALLVAGSTFPPSLQVLYASTLTSLLAFIVSWAKARNVMLPPPKEVGPSPPP